MLRKLPPLDFMPFAPIILAQRERFFLWTPILLACGVGLYFALPFEPDWRSVSGSFVLLCSLYVIARNKINSELCRAIFIAGLIVMAGILAGQARTHFVHTPLLGKPTGAVMLQARVLEVESLEGKSDKRLLLGDVSIEDMPPEQTPRKVRLRLRKDPGVKVGERVELLASLMPLSSPTLPGGFDFQRYFYFQGIGAVGFIMRFERVLEDAKNSWFSIQFLRQVILQKIEAALEGPQSGIVSALMINEVSSIAEEDHEAMRVSGLAHMLSISGLHVVLVAGGIFFAVRLGLAGMGLALHHPVKKYAAILGFAAAIFYMLLAGSNIPVQRSVLMTGVVFLAMIFDRFPFSLRLVAFAALVVLAVAPDSILSPSFQMSFAAVTALVWFYETTRDVWARLARDGGWIVNTALYFGGICATSIIASLATAPFGIYHFQTFGVYSLPANLFGVPVLSFLVMPAGVIALVAMPLGLEYWPLQVMGWGAGFILEIAHWAASLPYASIKLQVIPFAAFISFVIAVLWAMLAMGRLKIAAAIPLLFSIGFLVVSRPPDILIAADGKLSGIVIEDGRLALSTKRREKFTAEAWESVLAQEKGTAIDWKEAQIPCDELGCRFEKAGYKIAFSERPEAQAVDCLWATAVIASYGIEDDCPAPIVIDRRDTFYRGAHAIWLENPPRFESAGQYRGQRPWVGRKFSGRSSDKSAASSPADPES